MKLAIRKTVSKAKVLQGPHRQYSKTDTIRDCFSRKVAEIGRSSPKKTLQDSAYSVSDIWWERRDSNSGPTD